MNLFIGLNKCNERINQILLKVLSFSFIYFCYDDDNADDDDNDNNDDDNERDDVMMKVIGKRRYISTQPYWHIFQRIFELRSRPMKRQTNGPVKRLKITKKI